MGLKTFLNCLMDELSLRLFVKLFESLGAATLNNLATNVCLIVNGSINL